MKGCIAKNDNGDYLLVAQKGARVVLNSSGDLGEHLGQQVKISGTFVNSPNDPAKPGSKAHGAHEFRVIKVDVLAPTCNAQPAKKKK